MPKWIDNLFADPNPFGPGKPDVREAYRPSDAELVDEYSDLVPDGWDGSDWDAHVATSLYQGQDPMDENRWPEESGNDDGGGWDKKVGW